ncbi:MAG TPA: peptidoglycan DD-metalloendopeptidase family protein [Thermoanaerobaculia bacterium]|nr:peptidoglycan DD-metalloendopeptidase family protein [Thermoanaerobaculia bacterium]
MELKRVKLAPHFVRLALPLGLILLGVGLFLTTRDLEAYNQSPYPLPPTLRYHQRIALPTEASGLIDQARIPVEFKLMRGETVADVFEKLGLDRVEARQATDALGERLNLRRLKAGNQYSAFFNPDSTLDSFHLTLEGSGRIAMTRASSAASAANTAWRVDWQPFERTVRMRALRGNLDGSLDTSIRRAGGPAGLSFRMADVLQWDLDFSRDLKRGDQFEILYEEVLLEGEPHAVGQIYALVYDDSRGRRHEAYRYGDSGTYYDGEGRPLKKMFLRSPLRYSRITSGFTTRRFHPVLKSYRPHWGVDYGAPVGTPVQVTASGVVTSTGWDRGGGNVVKVRHAGGYVTAYLHLSRFAKGIRPGVRVRQGDIVAYTGATGLASGPHLDYRVQHNGRWIDPLTLKSVRDEPIPSSQLASFRSWRNEVLSSLQRGTPSPKLQLPGGAPETLLAVQDAELEQPAGQVAR